LHTRIEAHGGGGQRISRSSSIANADIAFFPINRADWEDRNIRLENAEGRSLSFCASQQKGVYESIEGNGKASRFPWDSRSKAAGSWGAYTWGVLDALLASRRFID
jgi:hypothetical protein